MSVEVEIELSKKNYFNFYFIDYAMNIKKYLFGYIIVFWFTVGAIFFILSGAPVTRASILLLPLVYKLIRLIIVLKNSNIQASSAVLDGLNKFKFIFDEEKFVVKDRVNDEEYKVSALLTVTDTKNYLFLYLYEDTAWILPKNQLGDKYNEILEFLNRNNISIKTYNWC